MSLFSSSAGCGFRCRVAVPLDISLFPGTAYDVVFFLCPFLDDPDLTCLNSVYAWEALLFFPFLLLSRL
jgi:hypothetical protein